MYVKIDFRYISQYTVDYIKTIFFMFLEEYVRPGLPRHDASNRFKF